MRTSRSVTLPAFTAFLSLTKHTLAHMEMSWPIPFRSKFDSRLRSAQIDYNMMAPLSADGSDFPCKGYEYDTIQGATADYTRGQTYNMTFAGTIMHGGGSCQIALSYDRGKTFKVIKSIIGGCPYKMTYDFTIPTYAPEGTAVLAWTWQNNIGNREFYMNCAEVQVSQAASPVRRQASTPTSFDQLPAIWVANLPTINNCKTVPEVSPVYPFPGPDVEYGGGYDSSSPPTAADCEVPARFKSYGGGLVPVPYVAPSAPSRPYNDSTVTSSPSPLPAQETSGMPVMAAAQATAPMEQSTESSTPSASDTDLDDSNDLHQRPYNIRIAAASTDTDEPTPPSEAAPAHPTITIYTTISICPTESVTTIYQPPTTPTWTTSYTARPTPTSNPDVIPFPPSSPSYIPTAEEANLSLLPCVPSSLLCQSRTSFLTCGPTPPDSPISGQQDYSYGYPRQVADGMACLPFLSPYSGGDGGQGRQDSGIEGYYRDDRYVRDREDGSCPVEREGEIRCKEGGAGFFVCDQGGWVDMGATAEGTVCREGEIVGA